MKLSIGSDHGGHDLKKALIERLTNDGYDILDRGPDSNESVDYPDFAEKVALDITKKTADYGILICTTGIGVSISANKVKGIRAALVHNEDATEYSRKHNNANVICFGQKYHSPELAHKLVKIFTKTEFDGGRHERRINKITELESK